MAYLRRRGRGDIAAKMHAAIRTAALAGIVVFSSCRMKCVFKDNLVAHRITTLRGHRIERAQRLGAECGIASPSHLTNMFQRIGLERPSRWRRIQRR